MRFLFLIHGDREAEAALSPDERSVIVGEHIAYASMLRKRGAYVLGEALDDAASAVVVRPGEKPMVTDGPFAETKEAVGGFYVVDCASRRGDRTGWRRSAESGCRSGGARNRRHLSHEPKAHAHTTGSMRRRSE